MYLFYSSTGMFVYKCTLVRFFREWSVVLIVVAPMNNGLLIIDILIIILILIYLFLVCIHIFLILDYLDFIAF